MLRRVLIALPLTIIALCLIAGAVYFLEPRRVSGFETLKIVEVIEPGGTRYQAGSWPEWNVTLPNGNIGRLRPRNARTAFEQSTVCARIKTGIWTGALHITEVAPARCKGS